MDKRKKKKIIGITTVAMGATFVGLTYFAKKKQPDSIFENDPNQKNPLEGKRVIFVEDEKDKENADGVKGHLVEIGDSLYRPSFYEKYIKRGMDVLLSFGGLVVLSPIMGTIALAIKLEDPGPVLFTQKRLGQNKQYFKLHKFRSMKMSTPHDVPTHMLDNPDQYITKVGKFIRAHSLDELPQIWDIFIGNMSVIGPRPGLWNQDLLTAERDKYSANDVKPGLTGWAQINGRDELEIPDKAKLDGEYVKHLGPKMDTKIFLDSLHVFSNDESVVEGGTGEMKKTSVGRHYTDEKSKEDLIGPIGFGQPVEVDTTQHKKILITGKGSYIGETFKEYANHHYPDNFEIDTLDMLDPTWKENDFSKYDVVYHVAGIAHADVGNVSDETKEKYYKVNTDLAIEVCQKAKQDHVKEFIFMSSMIVYGDSAPYGQKKIIGKDTVPNPANFYGDSKLQADVAVRELADDDFKVLVLRPPMIYGKGSKGNYPTLAKLAKKLPIFPDVENQRSMLYIENLCEFLCQVMLVKTINRNSIVLFPQNKEYTKTADMVKEIANASNHNIFESKLFNPAVVLGNKVPGKVSGLVNKAFGNNCYDKALSQYEGIKYQKIKLKESIQLTQNRKTKKNNIHHKLTDLKGKKILLIALPGYSNGMIETMKSMGAQVDYIHDKPNEGFLSKTLGRLNIGFYQKVIADYYNRELDKYKNKDYDFILSIRGEYTPICTLQHLKNLYPNAKLILYMWDGMHKQNTKGIEKKWPFYDQIYTFDRYDYEENKEEIDFLPLYYYEGYLPKNLKNINYDKFTYDVSFIGTGHDDRIKVVKDILKQCKNNGYSCFSYFFIPHKLIFYKNKVFNKNFNNVSEGDINYKMIPFKELYRIYADSKCIIDVENRGQHGLTMRTIETLGLRRKFITTNKDIINYDFYNPNNILVVDRSNPVVDLNFLELPYQELDEEIYQKYSIKNWILEVLS